MRGLGGASGQRLDRWLFHARFLRSRTLASAFVAAGHVRINGARTRRAATTVRPGDTLTLALRGGVRVVRVTALAERRGPPTEARTLYEDLTPPATGLACDRGRV